MHPVLVNLFQGLADKIDEDPEKFVRKAKTLGRRFKKKIRSREFQKELDEITARSRKELMRMVARKLRSYR